MYCSAQQHEVQSPVYRVTTPSLPAEPYVDLIGVLLNVSLMHKNAAIASLRFRIVLYEKVFRQYFLFQVKFF